MSRLIFCYRAVGVQREASAPATVTVSVLSKTVNASRLGRLLGRLLGVGRRDADDAGGERDGGGGLNPDSYGPIGRGTENEGAAERGDDQGVGKRPRAAILIAALPVLAQSAPEVKAILPVVGSTAGGFGSNFKTEVQFHNRGSATMHGMVVFHPQGSPAGAGDPVATYELTPRQTLHFDDLVATLGTSGLGSLDVIPLEGGIPAVVARAYDDQGELGTSGATIDLLDPPDALVPGVEGILIVPSSLQQFRYNVGVRSLGEGALLRVTLYDQSGMLHFSVERSYAPHYFEQKSVAIFSAPPSPRTTRSSSKSSPARPSSTGRRPTTSPTTPRSRSPRASPNRDRDIPTAGRGHVRGGVRGGPSGEPPRVDAVMQFWYAHASCAPP